MIVSGCTFFFSAKKESTKEKTRGCSIFYQSQCLGQFPAIRKSRGHIFQVINGSSQHWNIINSISQDLEQKILKLSGETE
jgi:hypothetical protein